MQPQDHLRRLALWTVVCSICAVPSAWVASDMGFDIAAMIAGVAAFVVLMTVLTGTQKFYRFKRRPFVRRTLYIGYGLRILISIVAPVGFLADMWPGMISIGIVNAVGIETKSFTGTFLITVIQGGLLNALLALFMGVLYALQRAFITVPCTEGLCEECGYDLRATPQRCPECGTIPSRCAEGVHSSRA